MEGQKKVDVFRISGAYELKQILGVGAYGTVAKAVHRPSMTQVAIKKIEPFHRAVVCLRTIRELQLLSFFAHHENIIGLYDVQKPKDYESFNTLYLIQEYMPSDLHRVIQTRMILNDHITFIVYQILCGLKVIHSANVIHRDLKPSNILINWSCQVKICDFGLSRIVGSEQLAVDGNLTEYVATRWYRAPEIMLLHTLYSTAVDLWSVGCIMAELFLACPLFPGRDFKHQLQLIFDFLGTPKGRDFRSIRLERSKAYIELLPVTHPVDIPSYFSNHPRRIQKYGYEPLDAEGLDLMKNLLSFNPDDRYTAPEALAHYFLAAYHDPLAEPVAGAVLEPSFFDRKSREDLSMSDLKRHLYEEAMNFSGRKF